MKRLVRSLCVVLLFVAIFVARPDALGGRPVVYKMPVDDVFVTNYCGFPMRVTTTGSAVIHLFLDDAGNFERVIITGPDIKIAFTNLNTGESVWTPSVNMVEERANDDGTGTKTLRGLLDRLVVPHQGLITADAGRIDFLFTFDEDGNIISEDVVFIAGQQDNVFVDTVCGVLG